jgi:hypothetical protein
MGDSNVPTYQIPQLKEQCEPMAAEEEEEEGRRRKG